MPQTLDECEDRALAQLFALPAGGTAYIIAEHWGATPTTGWLSSETLRLEDAVIPPPEIKQKRIGRVGEANLDYEIGRLFAQGGGGRVFEGRQVSTGRGVAIKRLPPEWAEIPSMRSRFLREGFLAAEFNHPHLLAVYDAGLDQDGQPFIVMPRVEGVPWSRSIQESSFKENLSILIKVTEAVSCLHGQGVIHRDIKPANVLLGPNGEAWLTDWGLALHLSDPGRGRGLPEGTASGGTPAYMAPEMARDERALVGFKSDVYLLGAVLLEMLTGQPPHAAENAAESLALASAGTIPKPPGRGAMGTLASRMLKNDPAERPTLAEVADVFQEALRPAFKKHLAYLLLALLGVTAILVAWILLRPTDGASVSLHTRGEVEIATADLAGKAREAVQEEIRQLKARLDAIQPLASSRVHFTADPESGQLTGIMFGEIPLGSLEFLRGRHTLRQVGIREAGIADLEPLRGIPITELDLMDNAVADLSPLAGMPLRYLNLANNPLSSLEPLRDMPLKTLLIGGTKVEDLTPLAGLPLEEVDLGGSHAIGDFSEPWFGLRVPAYDLKPLRGAPLRYLRADKDAAGDGRPLDSLTFLTGNTTLRALSVSGNGIQDLLPLKDAPLLYVDVSYNQVIDLSPLAGPSLDFLDCRNNLIKSLNPLSGNSLGVLLCDGNPLDDYSAYLTFPNLRAAWSDDDDGLPSRMPNGLKENLRHRLKKPLGVPIDLADDDDAAAHSGYFRLYKIRPSN